MQDNSLPSPLLAAEGVYLGEAPGHSNGSAEGGSLPHGWHICMSAGAGLQASSLHSLVCSPNGTVDDYIFVPWSWTSQLIFPGLDCHICQMGTLIPLVLLPWGACKSC